VEQEYIHAGMQAAAASLGALYYRDRTGEAQHIDISMQESITAATFLLHVNWEMQQAVWKRQGQLIATGLRKPHPVCWPCKDGYVGWMFMTAKQGAITRQLIKWMDEEGMAEDLMDVDWESTDYASRSEDAMAHWSDVTRKFFLTKTKREIAERGIKDRNAVFVANAPEDLVIDEQLNFRNYWVPVDVPESKDTVLFPNVPLHTSELTFTRRRAPMLGEHNQEVYQQELGLSATDISRLQQNKTIQASGHEQ
jgi:crotonobetainyl-CoA:carnitine CoA-transferase CaiB-like acyl-CoA transferase